jgi:hypothetical protein
MDAGLLDFARVLWHKNESYALDELDALSERSQGRE